MPSWSHPDAARTSPFLTEAEQRQGETRHDKCIWCDHPKTVCCCEERVDPWDYAMQFIAWPEQP